MENLDVQGNAVDQINDHIQQWLRSGEIVFDQTKGYEFLETERGFEIVIENREDIRKRFREDAGLKIEGPCRFVIPAVIGKLEALGLIKDFEVYVQEDIMHFAFLATVEVDSEDKKVLLEIGRRRPVPVAVPLDEGAVLSDFYSDLSIASYEARSDGEGIVFKIILNDGEIVKDIKYRKLKGDFDEIRLVRDGIAHHDVLVRAEFSGGVYDRVDMADTEVGQLRLRIREALKHELKDVIVRFKREEGKSLLIVLKKHTKRF